MEKKHEVSLLLCPNLYVFTNTEAVGTHQHVSVCGWLHRCLWLLNLISGHSPLGAEGGLRGKGYGGWGRVLEVPTL